MNKWQEQLKIDKKYLQQWEHAFLTNNLQNDKSNKRAIFQNRTWLKLILNVHVLQLLVKWDSDNKKD